MTVVGAQQWLPKYGFGFSMKLDARDAFNLLRMVRAIFFMLFLLLLASLVLCSNPSAAAAHRS